LIIRRLRFLLPFFSNPVSAIKPPGAPEVKFARTKEQRQSVELYKKRIEQINKAKEAKGK
jgi:hypothetical protein